MTPEKRISLSALWNQTKVPDAAVQHLERGGYWAIQWLPPLGPADWRDVGPIPEKTTVYKALYRYERIAGRDWALLAKWEDSGMQWAAIGQFSK